MTKKRILTLFIVLIIMMLNYHTYCSDLKISTNLQQLETDSKTVEVKVGVTDILGTYGINAYSGELIFNPNQLELVRIEGTNIWNAPSYNEENAKEGSTKVVSTTNQFTKEYGNLFTAIFNKKTNNKLDEVKFSNFEAAAKVDGKTIKVKEDTVEEKVETTENELNDNVNNNNGVKIIIIGIIVAICFLLICLCMLNKKTEKGENKNEN